MHPTECSSSTGANTAPNVSNNDEDCIVSDNIDAEQRVSIRPSVNAKVRQKQRDISDSDIQDAMENHTQTPVGRRRDGVKVYTGDDGVTALVGGGEKHRVITTWREEEGYHFRDTWVSRSGGAKDGGNTGTVTVSETFLRYRKCAKSSWEEGTLVRKNQKHRKHFMVVGLNEELIPNLAKQISTHAGCHCTIGTLKYDEWYDSHGAVDPGAAEGSKILSFNFAEGTTMISIAAKELEAVVPASCRRYLRENKSEAVKGRLLIEDISNEYAAKSAEAQDAVESIRRQILVLYSKHAPAKVDDVPALLAKYKGREEKLLEAIREKYERQDSAKSSYYYYDQWPRLPQCVSTVNVEDMMGDDQEEMEGEEDGPFSPTESQRGYAEDISGYF